MTAPLSSRLRPNVECAPWVVEAVRKLEAELALAQGAGGSVEPDGYTLFGQLYWMADCNARMKAEGTPVYLHPQCAMPPATAPATAPTEGDERILWGVVANAGHYSRRKTYRWAHVMQATGLGSSSSIALCARFGFDPDKMIGGDAEGDDE